MRNLRHARRTATGGSLRSRALQRARFILVVPSRAGGRSCARCLGNRGRPPSRWATPHANGATSRSNCLSSSTEQWATPTPSRFRSKCWRLSLTGKATPTTASRWPCGVRVAGLVPRERRRSDQGAARGDRSERAPGRLRRMRKLNRMRPGFVRDRFGLGSVRHRIGLLLRARPGLL